MICANPDLEVIRGKKREICAGSLAQRYEELGGKVKYFGKPYKEIYEKSLKLLKIKKNNKILALGDSLRTDIAGANNFGIDSLLITSGIHQKKFNHNQPDWLSKKNIEGTAIPLSTISAAILEITF